MPALSLLPAPLLRVRSFVDCAVAGAWVDGRFRVFPGKHGEDPLWGEADDLRYADGADAVAALTGPPEAFRRPRLPSNAAPGAGGGLHGAVWFESVHALDAGGSELFAVYHNENYPATLPYDPVTGAGYPDADWPPGLLGEASPQAVPRIGIMRSSDGGRSWSDRGVLLEDLAPRLVLLPVNRNRTFPGGVGDPGAVVCGDHLYVVYGEYGYPGRFDAAGYDPDVEAAGQCLSVARVPLGSLDAPGGAARRWDGSAFAAAPDGVGAPIPALQIPASDGGGPCSAGDRSFFWGPSVSWNESLECWIMVMARSDAPSWVGDSIWWSSNPHADLGAGAAAQDWTPPRLLLRTPGTTLWYPTLQPLAAPEDVERRRTSARLGARARLWVKEIGPDVDGYLSRYEVAFGAP